MPRQWPWLLFLVALFLAASGELRCAWGQEMSTEPALLRIGDGRVTITTSTGTATSTAILMDAPWDNTYPGQIALSSGTIRQIPVWQGTLGWDHVHPLTPTQAPPILSPFRGFAYAGIAGLGGGFVAACALSRWSNRRRLNRHRRCAECGAVQHTTADHQEALAEMGTEW
jgi:hypothetical protein